VARLKEICELHVVQGSSIDDDNVLDLLQLSDTYNAAYIRSHCIKYLAKSSIPLQTLQLSKSTQQEIINVRKVLETLNYERYCAENMQVSTPMYKPPADWMHILLENFGKKPD
jgi:hypothetical protein